MDRTLFTPAMLETFRVCRRAYQLAFVEPAPEGQSPAGRLTRRFILKAIAEINRGRLSTLHDVQKFLGQHWPSERPSADADSDQQKLNIHAFRFVYKALAAYVANPYRRKDSRVEAVNLKVRARVSPARAYVEDTFDLVLWDAQEQVLELIDFPLHRVRTDPACPSASILVRRFLAERLRSRFPFKKVLFTFCRIQEDGYTPTTIELSDQAFQVHWDELVSVITAAKDPENYDPHRNPLCKHCRFLARCMSMGTSASEPVEDSASRSA
jgi:hypothetical protein